MTRARVVSASPLCASTSAEALARPITPTDGHYVRDHFDPPAVDPAAWRLAVTGRVARPLSLGLDDLRARPARTLAVTLECAGNGRSRIRPVPKGVAWDDRAVGTAEWTGVPLADVLAEAAPEPGAVEALFRGLDRGVEHGRAMAFERSLPIDHALAGDALLAWAMNGAPLPPAHGAPVRLVVPGWYAVASVKWLAAIEVLDRAFGGWFQKDRYVYRRDGSPDAPLGRLRVKSLLVAPSSGAPLPAGRDVEVAGYAWSGEAPVAGVEVRVDGGPWHMSRLDPPLGPYAWRRFAWTWKAPAPGPHVVEARAHDAAGNAQPLEPEWNEFGYGENAVATLAVDVR